MAAGRRVLDEITPRGARARDGDREEATAAGLGRTGGEEETERGAETV